MSNRGLIIIWVLYLLMFVTGIGLAIYFGVTIAIESGCTVGGQDWFKNLF